MPTNSHEQGFVALIGVIFFSAVLGLMLFIRVERLAALDTEFYGAVDEVRLAAATASCSTIGTVTRLAGASFSAGKSFSVDFSSSSPIVSGITVSPTTCTL